MADAQPAEAEVPECEKEKVQHEEGAEAAAEADGCPPAKKAKTDDQEPVKLGPKTFASGQDILLYFANLLRAVTLNRDLNEVSAALRIVLHCVSIKLLSAFVY